MHFCIQVSVKPLSIYPEVRELYAATPTAHMIHGFACLHVDIRGLEHFDQTDASMFF